MFMYYPNVLYHICKFLLVPNQNYLTDLDGSVFLHENPIFMSVRIHPGCDNKWYYHNRDRHKDETLMYKYGTVQVTIYESVP